jgi:uncharacterized protein YciI
VREKCLNAPETESNLEGVYNMERPKAEKLFICEYKFAPSVAQAVGRFYAEGIPVPAEIQAIREPHLRYVHDLGKRGILWAGGPFADWTGGINIYAVDSLEEAKKAQENEPYHANGLSYDAKYSEWVLHSPLSMAAPIHKERLEKACRELGLL